MGQRMGQVRRSGSTDRFLPSATFFPIDAIGREKAVPAPFRDAAGLADRALLPRRPRP